MSYLDAWSYETFYSIPVDEGSKETIIIQLPELSAEASLNCGAVLKTDVQVFGLGGEDWFEAKLEENEFIIHSSASSILSLTED
mgnify:FL=1